MSVALVLPRLLIIDDLLGRTVPSGRNEERANFCGQYLIDDVTGDEDDRTAQKIKRPIAQAVFHRGQTPKCATVNDVVENDLAGTLEFLHDGWETRESHCSPWSLVLLDLCFYTGLVTTDSAAAAAGMPEGRSGDDEPRQFFGLKLLRAIHDEIPDLPVIVLSSHSRDRVSRDFARSGALGFLPRAEPESGDMLSEYIWRHGLLPDDTGTIVGRSVSLMKALRTARRAAKDRRNILILGERGTGKELLARYIHQQSAKWKSRPLEVINSGGLTPELYGSELFGHVRGSYTGASQDRLGRIVLANGGDLFLDEVGNMPADVQSGLLRVLEQREVTQLGAVRGTQVDVRFLSATNEDLESRCESGKFRKDLLDRLREGGTVVLPSLRERPEDIPTLVEKFVREAEQKCEGAMTRRIEPEALARIAAHSWPGNVRELRSCILNAVSAHRDVEHLVSVHLEFPDNSQSVEQHGKDVGMPASFPPEHDSPEALDRQLHYLLQSELSTVTPADLAGILPKLTSLTATYLRAVLAVTLQRTPQEPTGAIRIHRALKFATGNPHLSASSAADMVKRIANLSAETRALFESDPLLKEALAISVRLRPTQGKKVSS